jgi:hypothetical protein
MGRQKQIPHRLKSVRDDKNKGHSTARLKPCPFKDMSNPTFQQLVTSVPDDN